MTLINIIIFVKILYNIFLIPIIINVLKTIDKIYSKLFLIRDN